MSYIKISLSPVSVPSSYIKAPGDLFRDKKDPMDVVVNQKYIQNLLKEFKAQTESPVRSLPKFSSEDIISSPCNHKFYTSASADNINSPMKQKASSDDLHLITLKAQEILQIYGIQLHIEGFRKNFLEINFLLKFVITEICFFSSTLFKRLNINKLIISKAAEINYEFPQDGASLILDPIDSQEIVLHKLYKIMFDGLINAKPELRKEWEALESSSEGDAYSIEEIFVALMHNLNHALLKPKMKKLLDLLSFYFPVEISEEWFTYRNKGKKRMYKVRFDLP